MTTNLFTIINAIATTGHFSKIWKHGTMKFLPKPSKSPLSQINYRPISILEEPGKIAEKIINTRLSKILEDKQLHNDNQHGFRSNRRT